MHVLDRIPAFTLGCLEPEDTQQVVEHLRFCDRCQAELRAYQELVARLAIATPQVEPPLEMKSRLMGRLKTSRERRATPLVQTPSWWVSLSTMVRRSFAIRFSPIVNIVSLVLILILSLSNILLWRQVSVLRSTAQPQGWKVITLSATDFAPQASGVMVISADGHYGTLIVDDLPALSGDQQYQLWLSRDGERISGGVFSIDPDGYGSFGVSSSKPLIYYSSFGITIEPFGGSPSPTGKKVLEGGF